jgi:hypothetical protein
MKRPICDREEVNEDQSGKRVNRLKNQKESKTNLHYHQMKGDR